MTSNNIDDCSIYLGEKGYTIYKECLSKEEQEYIRNELTVKPYIPKSPIQPPSFPVYRESYSKMYIPRYWGIENYGPPQKIIISNGEKININFNGELRDYQINIVNTYLIHIGILGGIDKIHKNGGGGLLDVDPGKGKTVMALKIISQLGLKTLVVVHKTFLMNQWKERIQQFLPDARVGTIQGQIIDIDNKDIVLGMLQSLSMKDYPKNMFESFGLSCYDECFPFDTYILTNKGFIKIGELYLLWSENKDLPNILSFNIFTNQFEYKKMTYAWKKYKKELMTIFLKNETNFTCTPDHKILTKNGYKKANELDSNDYIICYKDNDIYYSSLIKKINVLYDNYDVFDIEVEDNHNFIIKPNGNNNEYPIVSNCHHMGAEVFSKCLIKIPTLYTLGLSGTMERKDGLTDVFKMFLGDVVYREKTVSDHAVLVKGIEYRVDDDEFNETKYDYRGNPKFSTMISTICDYSHRSEFILYILENELKINKEQQIMILGHNKSLLTYLYNAIEHRNIASVGYYIGGMKEAELKKSEEKKVIIATYAMASEGLDIKTLTTLIMASPKTDVCQSVGRILRAKHSSPLVIDIIDSHDIFVSQWQKRRKYYKSQNYKIIMTDNEGYKNNDWEVIYDPAMKKHIKKSNKSNITNNTNIVSIIDTPDIPLFALGTLKNIKENANTTKKSILPHKQSGRVIATGEKKNGISNRNTNSNTINLYFDNCIYDNVDLISKECDKSNKKNAGKTNIEELYDDDTDDENGRSNYKKTSMGGQSGGKCLINISNLLL